jgi:hypothetical protein
MKLRQSKEEDLKARWQSRNGANFSQNGCANTASVAGERFG